MVAWIGLGDAPQFTTHDLELSPSLIAWSIVAGPVFGLAAYGFRTLTRAATAHTPRGWHRVSWCLAAFFGIGLLATLFPQLPGNGKGPSQLGFDGDLGLTLAIGLLALKVLAVMASLRAGAAGGLLTPSLTLGALLATVLGYLWNLVSPSVPIGAFAIVGAAAFLASSMNMPLTASLLIIEFTRIGYGFSVPVFLAVATSVASLRGRDFVSVGDVQKLPHRLFHRRTRQQPGLRFEKHGRGLLRSVARRRDVWGRTAHSGPRPRYRSTVCVVFSQSVQAARPSLLRPPDLAPRDRPRGGEP